MILQRKVVAPLALVVALATVATGYYGGLGDAPGEFVGGEDLIVIGPEAGGLPGRAETPYALAPLMRSLESVEAVSPEVYAITAIDGRSVVVRGVELEAFLALEDARLAAGRLPSNATEAAVGERFAALFDVEPGDAVVVPGVFDRRLVSVRVVGIIASEGPAGDELLVALPTARALVGISADGVHLIRARTADAGNFTSLVTSVEPAFTYSDVSVGPLDALAGEPVTMRAKLTNWGALGGSKRVEVLREGVPLVNTTVYVPPRKTIDVSLSFTLDEEGLTNVTINPTFQLTVRAPQAQFTDLPGLVVEGRPVEARILSIDGAPLPGARVDLGSANATTDADGRFRLVPRAPGDATATARLDGERIAIARLTVINASHADRVEPAFTLSLPPGPLGVNEPVTATIGIRNLGGAEGPVFVDLTLDNATVANRSAYLAAGGVAALEVPLGILPAETHRLAIRGTNASLDFTAYPGKDPRVEQLLRSYERTGAAPSGPAPQPVSAESYIIQIVGDITFAIVALSIATFVVASVGVFAVVSRHLAMRAPSLGILKALGASDRHIVERAAREAAAAALAATLLGIVGGLALGAAIDALDVVRAFGHVVHPEQGWYGILLLALAAMAAIVGATVLLVRSMLAQPVDHLLSLKELRARDAPPRLDDVLERA